MSGHPIDRFREDLQKAGVKNIGELNSSAPSVTIGGIISQVRRLRTKKGDPMAVVTLEDRDGSLETVVFPEAFKKYGHLLEIDKLMVVTGKLDMDEEVLKTCGK